MNKSVAVDVCVACFVRQGKFVSAAWVSEGEEAHGHFKAVAVLMI